MRIEQRTKYRCDGCQKEAEDPCGWERMTPLLSGTYSITVGTGMQYGYDYCATCVQHMREAVAMPHQTAG